MVPPAYQKKLAGYAPGSKLLQSKYFKRVYCLLLHELAEIELGFVLQLVCKDKKITKAFRFHLLH